MTNDKIAISLRNLQFRYSKQQKLILDIPQWQVKQGEHVFLQGASGTGKSTLLNLLSGILPSPDDSITILQQDLAQLSTRQRDQFRARHIGVVFQQFNLIPYLNVLENISLAAHFAGRNNTSIRSYATALFAKLNLNEDLLQRQASQLSVGQQQRVAIVRALINQPEIVLADEPSSALDSELRDNFIELLLESCRSQNSTLIMVSHDMQLARHFNLITQLHTLNLAGRQPHAV